MSYIGWHSQHEDVVHIRGWERALFGQIVSNVATSFLPPDVSRTGRLNPDRFPGDNSHRRVGDISLSMRVGSGDFDLIDHDGTPLSSFSLLLNTVLAIGNDPLCLAARLHGQCELHCYVEGPNRAWLADIIEAGRDSGIYREGSGWEQLMDLLRSRDDEPVVTSYSVCDGFPSTPPNWDPPIGDDGEPDWDAWYDIERDEQWTLSMAALRDRSVSGGLEISPETLHKKFDHCRSLINLFVTSPVRV